MALFQNNILNKYVALLNSKELDVAYSKFCSYFHDVQRQNIIKTIKEEEFQAYKETYNDSNEYELYDYFSQELNIEKIVNKVKE